MSFVPFELPSWPVHVYRIGRDMLSTSQKLLLSLCVLLWITNTFRALVFVIWVGWFMVDTTESKGQFGRVRWLGNVCMELYMAFFIRDRLKIMVDKESIRPLVSNPQTKHVFIVNHSSNTDPFIVYQMMGLLSDEFKGTRHLYCRPSPVSSNKFRKTPMLYAWLNQVRPLYVSRRQDRETVKPNWLLDRLFPVRSLEEEVRTWLHEPSRDLFVFVEGRRSPEWNILPVNTGVLEEIERQARSPHVQCKIKICILRLTYQHRVDHAELMGQPKKSVSNKDSIKMGSVYIQGSPHSFWIGAGESDIRSRRGEVQTYFEDPRMTVLTDYHFVGIKDKKQIIQWLTSELSMHYDANNHFAREPLDEREQRLRWNHWLSHVRRYLQTNKEHTCPDTIVSILTRQICDFF